MSDTPATPDAPTPATPAPDAHAHDHDDHGASKYYMRVFVTLSICTVVSFLTVTAWWRGTLGEHSGNTLVMLVAVFKATLVAMFFMHLKWDFFKVVMEPFAFLGMMVVGALIMGSVLICALMPDMTFSRTRMADQGEAPAAIAYDPAGK